MRLSSVVSGNCAARTRTLPVLVVSRHSAEPDLARTGRFGLADDRVGDGHSRRTGRPVARIESVPRRSMREVPETPTT